MNILLISPATRAAAYKAFSIDLPPIGLMYIAGNLIKHGHAVTIIDENVRHRHADMSGFDVVGISAATCGYPRALALALEAKKKERFVVMGGYHATFSDEEAVRSGCVDVVVRGEGEEIMLAVVTALERGTGFDGIEGITYLRDGAPRRNGSPGIIRDLDSLPRPAREIVDLGSYGLFFEGKKVTSLVSSRGCVYDCHFCSVARFNGGKWRARSPRNVVDEMENILKNGWGEAIVVADDNFTLDPRRVAAICEDIVKRKLVFPWWCMSRVDTLVKNRDMVRMMARAGCGTVFLGLESGEERVLELHNKRATTALAEQAVSLLAAEGIRSYGSFIIGDVRETEADVRKTIAFSRKLGLDVAQFTILTPFPGSPLFDSVREKIVDPDWGNFNGMHSVFALDHLSKKKLERMLFKAYFSFYARPGQVRKFVASLLERKYSLKTAVSILRGLFWLVVKRAGQPG